MPFQVGFLPGIFQLTWSLQRTRTDRIPPNKDWKIFVLAIAAVSFSSSSLQRKFLTDKICVEWFECIGANYSGNGEILSRNASPKISTQHRDPKDLYSGFFPFGSKFKTGWWTNAWTCPQPDFLFVSHYYEDHHHCQHSRWTDALTVDMSSASLASVVDPPQGGVRSQICTARPPCRYHHPTCAVYFKIHFLENFKLFILRRSRSFTS